MRYFFTIWVISCSFFHTYGQLADSLKLGLSGSFIYQPPVNDLFFDSRDAYQVLLPPYLENRRKKEPLVISNWFLNNGSISDHPLSHGASYIRLHGKINQWKGLRLHTSLTAEHRGASYGPFNPNMVAVFPTFNLDYQDSLSTQYDSGNAVLYRLNLGWFEDFKYYEGLTLYNMDLQGVYGYVQRKHIRLSALLIAELHLTYGLNIPDLLDLQLSLEKLPVNNHWKTDIKIGTTYYTKVGQTAVDKIQLSAGVYRKEQTRIYGQVAYRFAPEYIPTPLNVAGLIGMENHWNHNKWNVLTRIEGRYYGGGFNYNLNSERKVHFRDPKRRLDESRSFIGTQVYPLRLLNRPFSQWAVFTEYHKQHIGGISMWGKMSYQWKQSWYGVAIWDVNAIMADGEALFIYPFYQAGVSYKPFDQLFVSLLLTNQNINLDKHYPTYYLLKRPEIRFSISRSLDWGIFKL